ncbi:UNVERIFIED_ORG: hypothetical protein DFO82_2410 [Idiomarina abyssalis]|uniref:hypothetical protein n=1 Tax=Idiomarina sp. 017G TaxID=2183988 RepID=UPI000E0EDE20|nr:hypothetical protein [Idiomarina sp. 017G]TDO46469.1 hypothetical protein DEU30_11044 [Idiomarina sp. 017G]
MKRILLVCAFVLVAAFSFWAGHQASEVNTPKTTDTSNEEELKREQLIAENPSFFEGQNKYFSDDGNYLYGVERFVPQNGISSWGISREKELSNLLSDQDGLLHAESECRLTMCITTGAFMSQQEFRSFSIDYNNLQFYGQRYGTKSLTDGLLVFYVITYKQTD